MSTTSWRRATHLPATGTLLIACGYLGAAMVRQLAPVGVTALTHTSRRHGVLTAAGVQCLACDLASPDLVAQIAPALRGFAGSIFFLAPPSVWRGQDPLPALARLLAFLRTLHIERAVLASSTAVYGDARGGCVDAGTAVHDRDARSHQLLGIEQAWMAADWDSYVVRLAGLYGPGRIIGQHGIARGESVAGKDDDVLNLVHIDDAARAMLATASAPVPLRYALISDGRPLLRRDYYGALAGALRAPVPSFTGAGGRRLGSRRCDPTSSWAALGVRPLWDDSCVALASLLTNV